LKWESGDLHIIAILATLIPKRCGRATAQLK
jgi:hypothetical protein